MKESRHELAKYKDLSKNSVAEIDFLKRQLDELKYINGTLV